MPLLFPNPEDRFSRVEAQIPLGTSIGVAGIQTNNFEFYIRDTGIFSKI